MVDVVRELTDFGMRVDVHDPWAVPEEVAKEYGISLAPITGKYEAVVLAVAHEEFKPFDFKDFTMPASVLFDLKATLPKENVDARL